MNASGRRALVLGATGHLGNAITRDLLAQGWHVTAATRQQRPGALAALGVEIVHGDADQPGRLAAWIPGHEWVIDAAAPYPLHLFGGLASGEAATLEQARRRMAALLEGVARSGATLGHVSSYTTLPRPRGEGALAACETLIRRRIHPYFALKSELEAMVLEAARAGLRAVVVNPTACLGPWDRRPRAQCVVPLLVTGQVPAMMARTLNVIDVRDVAAGLRAALEQRHFGVPLALAGHDCRTDWLAARVCALAGATAPRLRVPGRLVAVGALCAEAGWALLGRPSPMPAIGPLLVLDGYPMSPGAGQRSLGVRPRPLDETLRDAIDWYRGIGYC
ncbi:MAG TPA: NAD-dependent epimerase/dehydratase family protein [Variovorax sp.]